MLTISSWKDIDKNNVYKLFNFIIKITVLQWRFCHFMVAMVMVSGAVNKQNCRFWCEEYP